MEDEEPCFVCLQAEEGEILLLCEQCERPAHKECVGLKKIPKVASEDLAQLRFADLLAELQLRRHMKLSARLSSGVDPACKKISHWITEYETLCMSISC